MIEVMIGGDWEEISVSAKGHAAKPEVCAAVSILMQALEAWTVEGGLCQLHCGEKGRMELGFLHTDESYAAAGLLLSGMRLLAAGFPGELTLGVEGELFPMGELCLDRFGEEEGNAPGGEAPETAAGDGGPDAPAGRTEAGGQAAGESAASSESSDSPDRSDAEERRRTGKLRELAANAIAAELRYRSRDRLIRGTVRTRRVIADDLLRQSASLRQVYEDFSLADELADPRFRRLVKGGAALREAYEALHADRVRAAAEAETLRRIRLRGLRPPENGAVRAVGALSGGAAALTPADRDALARRALAGERITF